MSRHRLWQIAGAAALVVAAVLAVLSLIDAYRVLAIASDPDDASIALTALVFGVLAGVAFFSALACFFWSAMVEARQQRTEILDHLAALGEGERGSS